MVEKNANNQSSSEMDLTDLLKGVWVQRRLIFCVVFMFMLAAGAYSFLSKPVYEARAYLLPPTQNDIGDLNYGRTPESGMKPYTTKDVYFDFIQNLQSESLRREFFNSIYLPSLSKSDRDRSLDGLYRQFSADLTFVQPGKDFADRFTIVAQNHRPDQVAEWLRIYVDKASDATKKQIVKDVSKEVKVRVRNIESQIGMLRENAANTRQDTVRQLREAEKVAGAIGLQNHLIVSGSVTGDMSGVVDPRLVYLRGTKALEAEVKNLQDRESDDAFITDLRRLQGLGEFYRNIKVNAEDVTVYRLDGVIEPPDSPVKPRKALILVLGLILGLIFGVALGLMREYLTQSQKRYHSS